MNKYIIGGTIVIALSILASTGIKNRSAMKQAELKYQVEQQQMALERERDEQKQEDEEARERSLVTCLEATEENYTANWNRSCEIQGLPRTCNTLPSYKAKPIEDMREKGREECIRMFSR